MSIQGRKVASVAELSQPGDFCFWHVSEDGQCAFMAFKCPCGQDVHHRDHDSIPVAVGGWEEQKHWKWDGNQDAPTLSPSILRTEGCTWHGFLEAGVWRSV